MIKQIIVSVIVSIAVCRKNSDAPTAFLSGFDFIADGFDNSKAFSLYWSVPTNNMFHGCIVFNATQYVQKNPFFTPSSGAAQLLQSLWFGIGFGSSMLNANSIMAYGHLNTSQPPVFLETVPSGYYAPPLKAQSPVVQFNGFLQTTVANSYILVEFMRPLSPTGHPQILPDAATQIIFAFCANPNPNAQDGWKFYHGTGNRGSYLITASTGNAIAVSPDDINAKRVHGGVMAGTWLLLFPLSVFIAKYLRTLVGWVKIHIALQLLGTIVGVIGMAVYILISLGANSQPFPAFATIYRPHSILGWVVVALTTIQSLLGMRNRIEMVSHSLNADRSRIAVFGVRFSHQWLGRVLLAAGFVQAGLGLQILYPLSEIRFRGMEFWIAYGCVVILWILIWLVASRLETRRNASIQKVAGGVTSASDAKLPVTVIPLLTPKDPVDTEASNLRSYTWADIDQSIMNNDLLVVANGSLVYRINSWIDSHPGGRVILHAVAGTDITNDFFQEAGYDASVFVPRHVVRQIKGRVLPDAYVSPTGDYEGSKRGSTDRSAIRESVISSNDPSAYRQKRWGHYASSVSLDKEEWNNILRARRVHVHSRLAITRLSSMLVGQIAGSTPFHSKSIEAASASIFCPIEFRRYALVASTLCTPSGTLTPVYLLKYCLLYPFVQREAEPDEFLPGQCMEFQCRIESGEYVSRFYTPIQGSPSCFEVAIKVYPDGLLSQLLTKQKPGDRQVKIRGPFGTPLVDPSRPIGNGSNSWFFGSTVFIGGGSGLTPGLQLVETLLLPRFVPLYVIQPYAAQHPDEISLDCGDWVLPRVQLYDGWALGVNLKTRQEGLFPLPVTLPRIGKAKISIINATKSHFDVFSQNILEGALLAYPKNIQVTHCFSRGSPLGTTSIDISQMLPGGQKHVDSRLNTSIIKSAMQFVEWETTKTQKRIMLCGPERFQCDVVDMLYEDLHVLHDEIVVLPADAPFLGSSSSM